MRIVIIFTLLIVERLMFFMSDWLFAKNTKKNTQWRTEITWLINSSSKLKNKEVKDRVYLNQLKRKWIWLFKAKNLSVRPTKKRDHQKSIALIMLTRLTLDLVFLVLQKTRYLVYWTLPTKNISRCLKAWKVKERVMASYQLCIRLALSTNMNTSVKSV